MEDKKTAWRDVELLAVNVIKDAKHQAKLWFIAFLVTLAALVSTNIYWIYQFTSYDYVSQDGNGINNYNTDNYGDVINGPEN